MDASMPAAAPVVGREFFGKARARLSLAVPRSLHDPTVTDVIRGDLDLDPQLWEQAGVQAIVGQAQNSDGSAAGEGTRALNAYFSNWTFSRNVLIGRPAGRYPAGNFFPANVAAVDFVNYAGGNYALAANSPYNNAATDGTDIGAL